MNAARLAFVMALVALVAVCAGCNDEVEETIPLRDRTPTRVQTGGVGGSLLPLMAPRPTPARGKPSGKVCGAGEAHALPPRRIEYNLGTLVVEPFEFGPRIARMGFTGIPVSLAEIAARLHADGRLARCWSRARGCRPATDALLAVELELGEDGRATLAGVTLKGRGCRRFVGCARKALAAFALDRVPLRSTRASFTLRLGPRKGVRQGPKREAAPRPLPAGECVTFDRVATPDRLEERIPIARIGGSAPPLTTPRVIPTTFLREPFRYNLGAYRDCYREALKTRPGLSGWVLLSGHGTAGGRFVLTAAPGALKAPELLACLVRAAQEVRVPPLPVLGRPERNLTGIAVRFALQLRLARGRPPTRLRERSTASRIEGAAQTALILGDGLLAAGYYSSLVKQLPGHGRTCHWRIGIARALLALSPWRGVGFFNAVAAMTRDQKKPRTIEEKVCFAATREFLLQHTPRPDLVGPGLPMGRMAHVPWLLKRLNYALNDAERADLISDIAEIHVENLLCTKAKPLLARARALTKDPARLGRLTLLGRRCGLAPPSVPAPAARKKKAGMKRPAAP